MLCSIVSIIPYLSYVHKHRESCTHNVQCTHVFMHTWMHTMQHHMLWADYAKGPSTHKNSSTL